MTKLGGTHRLGDRIVHRMGYGAMQLAGPGVFGPPRDRDAALAVLREAVALGIDHIDTSDYYGPHVVNEIIREALGTVVGVENYGAGDILEIERSTGKRFMVPMIEDAVLQWDGGRVVVAAPYAE